jgi:resolvase-like protein
MRNQVSLLHKEAMIYGYARVSTDGQSEAAQVRQLRAAGTKKVFREVASGAKTDRPQLRRLLTEINSGDVVMVTRLDRLARSTPSRQSSAKKPGFDLSPTHGPTRHGTRAFDADRARRAGGVRTRIDPRPHWRRPRASQGARAELGPTLQAHPASAERGDSPSRPGRNAHRHRPQLQRPPEYDFPAHGLNAAAKVARSETV